MWNMLHNKKDDPIELGYINKTKTIYIIHPCSKVMTLDSKFPSVPKYSSLDNIWILIETWSIHDFEF